MALSTTPSSAARNSCQRVDGHLVDPGDLGGVLRLGRVGTRVVQVVQEDDPLQIRKVLACEHVREVVSQEALHREQHPCLRGPQDVSSLAPLEAGVDRHEDRAGTDHPECGDDPCRRVGRPDPDPVPRFDPYADRRSRDFERPFGELGEAETEVAVDQGLPIAEAFGGVRDEAGDRAPPEVPAGVVV